MTRKSTDIYGFFVLFFSDEEGYGWVDSVGWDDLDRDDNEIFKEMLQFLNRHKLLSVKAIIWTVRPDIKMTNTLNQLAQFIDAFSKRDIWNNVIIIGNAFLYYIGGSPAFLTSDDFVRSNEIIRTKWPIYQVIRHFVLTI